MRIDRISGSRTYVDITRLAPRPRMRGASTNSQEQTENIFCVEPGGSLLLVHQERGNGRRHKFNGKIFNGTSETTVAVGGRMVTTIKGSGEAVVPVQGHVSGSMVVRRE